MPLSTDEMTEIASHDPLVVLGFRFWPAEPEPSDILAWCEKWDREANVGAGAPR